MIYNNLIRKFSSLVRSKKLYQELIRRKGGIYILMYHSISADKHVSSFQYDISASSFKHQLSTLANIVEFVHPTDLRSMGDITNTEEPQVLITFDDGYYNNYSVSYPILRDLGIPALLFVPTEFMRNPLDTFLNWSQVRELADDDLLNIGSHTCSHWNLKMLSSNDIAYEIKQSKKELEKHVDQEVYSISYPGGGFNQEVIQCVERSEYEFGFKDRSQTRATNQYTLSRISVDKSNYQPWKLLRSMLGAQPINTADTLRNQ